MKYDPINKIMVEDSDKTKDSKTKDLERPYFDPLYKDTRRAIVREVQNYLSSKGYNNSVGKYDKVVRGVRSLLEKTLLQPGTDKFNDAVHQEVDRLLKKYNLTNDSNFDDAVKKYFDSFKGKSKIEVEKLVAKAKGNPAAEEAYKKYLDSAKTKDASELDINQVIKTPGMLLRVKSIVGKNVIFEYYDKATNSWKKRGYAENKSKVISKLQNGDWEITGKSYDSKAKDAFNKVDLKSIFGGTDRRWLVAKKDFKDSLAKANTVQELEKIYDDMSHTNYSDIIDDYLDIWNEVGKYAQDKRRQCINELNEMRSEAFKKLNKFEKEKK